jgi:8-oxo-dGTP diphosphatase
MEKQVKVGCIVIIIKNGKLLLGKRKNVYGDGSWGLPGGHLEYGEKLVEAAKRELKEEIGVEAAGLEFAGIIDDIRPHQHYLQVTFRLKEAPEEVKNIEPERCEEWRYFDLDNLPENIFEGHIEAIRMYGTNK